MLLLHLFLSLGYILSNLLIVQKNLYASSASNCMVVPFEIQYYVRKKNIQLYFLSCLTCAVILADQFDTYLHP